MSCYIASNDNRLYTVAEQTFGEVADATSDNRIPAVRFSLGERVRYSPRRDKTGTRSFLGIPNGAQKEVEFELQTYLTGLPATGEPACGPLFEAAMGTAALVFTGGTIAAAESPTRVRFSAAHGLEVGQALSAGNDIRFVVTIVNATTVEVNAPFSTLPSAGSTAGPTVTYKLGNTMPSVSIFDYWSPSEAVQRVVAGAAVNKLRVLVNSDYHEFRFQGPAKQVIDSITFSDEQGGLSNFPAEPVSGDFSQSIVPGHMGQVWLGPTPERFYTLTDAELTLDNGIETRSREFGVDGLRCVTGGQRSVQASFEVLANDDAKTVGLFEAARQRTPFRAMFQLGQQEGQLFGAYMKSVIADMPSFEDAENRLLWKFRDCRAQGTGDDELVVAFG